MINVIANVEVFDIYDRCIHESNIYDEWTSDENNFNGPILKNV